MSLLTRLIHTRRTFHRFDAERKVSRELLVDALHAAMRAPNHKHTEPWCFYMLGPKQRQALIDLNVRVIAEKSGEAAAEAKRKVWEEVDGYFVLTCKASADPVRYQEDRDACACAAQNFALVLWNEGAGVKWTTGPVTRHPAFPALFGFDPTQEHVVGLFMYGYPRELPPAPARTFDDKIVWGE